MSQGKLLQEIEAFALAGSENLTDALLRCVLLGRDSGSQKLRDWAVRELKGYGPHDDLPSYRNVPSVIALDGMTGFALIRGQVISRHALPEELRERFKERLELRAPIPELTSYVRTAEDGFVRLVRSGVAEAAWLANYEWNVPDQHVERIYHMVSASSIEKVLEAVRTTLIELVAEIRAGAGQETEPLTKELADRAHEIVIQGDHNRVSLTSAGRDLTSIVDGRRGRTKPTVMSWIVGVATVVGALAAVVGLLRAPW